MAHLTDADRVIIRQQPFAPQFLVPGFFVLAQCPFAVRLIAFLHDLVKCFIGQFRSCDLRQLPAGVTHIGFLQQSDPQRAAQIEKDGFILFFHRSSFKPAQGRCPAIQKGW